MSSGELAQRLRDTADLLDAYPPTPDALRAIQEAENALAVAKARLVTEMVDRFEYQDEGYSSPRAWLRHQLHLDTAEAGVLLAAGHTLAVLPEIENVSMSLAHLRYFNYAIKHVGVEPTREVLSELLDVAAKAEPDDLRGVVRTLRETVFPDSLEEAWIRGMNREDVKLSPVGDGWHLSGFLNATTGAKLDTLLRSLSAPAGADDPRTASQRRVDGLERLLDSVLANGLPGDQGVRPHLTITVDAADVVKGTGRLVGFGSISNAQLQEIICDADITPLLTNGPEQALDVGRKRRLATYRQRQAINAQQNHCCAAPGCRGPVVHVHHVVYWSDGGTTDLINLIGLCPRCHRAVHAGILRIDPVTRQFTSTRQRLARAS